ncbi:MAG: hypothetical protein HPY81_06430 [Firmicutes bacterium]|nr:hypothetical protein [Bacillota bacterium]
MIDFSLLEVRSQHGKYVFYYQGNRMAIVKCYLRNAELVGAVKATNDQINEKSQGVENPKVRSLAVAQIKKLLPADLDLRPEDLLGYEVSPCSEMKKMAMQGPLEEYQHLLDYIRETALQRFVNDLIKLVRDDIRRALDDYINEAYGIIEQNEHNLLTVFQKRSENTIDLIKTQLPDENKLSQAVGI